MAASEASIVAFVEEELRMPLYPGQKDLLNGFQASGASQAAWLCGRQGGKSTLADCLAIFDAVAREFPGRRGIRSSVIVSPTLEQSRDHILRIREMIADGTEELQSQVDNATADEISFISGVKIRARPASGRALRGVSASSIVLDEFGFVLESEGNASSEAILSAAQPALSTFGHRGWLIACSTPWLATGGFHRLCEEAQSGRFRMHFHHAPSWELNPTIPDSFFAQEKLRDPQRFAREYAAEWIEGTYSFMSLDDINACSRDESVTPPKSGPRYVASLDAGFQGDSTALAIAHLEDDVVWVDGVWTWTKKGFEQTMNGAAEVLRRYHVRQVQIDQHATVPIQEALSKRDFAVRYSAWTSERKYSAFSILRVGLSVRTVSLPNCPDLVSELCYLEAHSLPSGATRVAASGHRHDDLAVAVAAVTEQLAGKHQARPEDVHRAIGLMEVLREPERGLGSLNGLLGDSGGSFGSLGMGDGGGRIPF